eukprot:scaffold1094_cov185-Alexandrium_tamarense.AAC.22
MFRQTAKLSRNMLILSETDVRRCFPVSAVIAANRKALSSLRNDANGGAVVPSRTGLSYPSHNPVTGGSSSGNAADWSLFKPAAYYPPINSTDSNNTNNSSDDIIMGMKIISIRADNPIKFNKPTCPSTIMLVHPETGEVSSIVAATYLTAARTSAGSAIATELALKDRPRIEEGLSLVVFGAGLQAEMHIRSIQYLLNIGRVVIVNRSLERADKLKGELMQSTHDEESKTQTVSDISIVLLSDKEAVQNAVRSADIVATTTNTSTSLFRGEWLKAGCHINAVGSYTSLTREVDDELVKRSEILIDTQEALDVGDLSYLKENRDAMNCIGLIGDAIVGNISFGKLRDGTDGSIDCTFYKSVGTAIQDVVSAQYVYDNALKIGIGVKVEM